jgi:hypothetical protein
MTIVFVKWIWCRLLLMPTGKMHGHRMRYTRVQPSKNSKLLAHSFPHSNRFSKIEDFQMRNEYKTSIITKYYWCRIRLSRREWKFIMGHFFSFCWGTKMKSLGTQKLSVLAWKFQSKSSVLACHKNCYSEADIRCNLYIMVILVIYSLI